jgi:cytochrome c
MRTAQHVWNDGTLDTWLTDPAAMNPGNRMTFPGIKDASARNDLLAFLKDTRFPDALPRTIRAAGWEA